MPVRFSSISDWRPERDRLAPRPYMRETGRNPVKSSVDFLLTCLHKSLVDFRLPPATNLKLKAFEGRAVVIRLICEQHRKLYGHTGFTRGHGTTVGLERRRSGGARPSCPAGL